MAKVTLDTPLSTILDDPQAKKVLDQYAPGISTNPMVGMLRPMTINNILAMPQAAQFGITKEKAQAMVDEINKHIK
jgi:hypothetical protein